MTFQRLRSNRLGWRRGAAKDPTESWTSRPQQLDQDGPELLAACILAEERRYDETTSIALLLGAAGTAVSGRRICAALRPSADHVVAAWETAHIDGLIAQLSAWKIAPFEIPDDDDVFVWLVDNDDTSVTRGLAVVGLRGGTILRGRKTSQLPDRWLTSEDTLDVDALTSSVIDV